MLLSELLIKYDRYTTLIKVIDSLNNSFDRYVTINEEEDKYIITPTFAFYKLVGSTRTSISLDKNYQIITKDCGCLEYYKKKECLHVVCLYVVAIYQLNNKLFQTEYNKYLRKKKILQHNEILNRLYGELKTSNSYFGLIHLIPCIESYGKNYLLSLKVGYDKDYVVKSIIGFIQNTENNIEYSYGQKLTFIHSYECFDDVSKEFYSFLRNICSETSEKNVEIRKSHLLKILEIYNKDVIFFKENEDAKFLPRRIVNVDGVTLKLNDESLFIEKPNNSNVFISGVNNAYFIDDEYIYTYSYKTRMEGKIFDCLYKVDGGLIIDVNSNDFISNLLPMIQNLIKIEDKFYEKYPIPQIKIDSYISYYSGNIYLNYEIKCDESDKDSPYMNQLLSGYNSIIEGYNFSKNRDNLYNISSIENQYLFLTNDLSSLKAFGQVYFDESMRGIRAKKSAKTSIGITYNVGLLDFKFENSSLSIEEIQAMLLAYHQKKKFIKLKDNTIIEIDEEDARQIDNFLEDFNISVKEINKKVLKPLNYLLKLVNVNDENLSVDSQISEMINSIQNYKNSDYNPSDKYNLILRNYQVEGFRWLKTLSSFGFGGILADDMGLGKTLEIISFLESDTFEMPSIIVCPMSLVYNWQNECEKWGLNVPVVQILGGAEAREAIINNIDANKKALYITSYDSLRRDISLYNIKFRFVIADEAQFIKNQFAQKSEAIKSLKSEINFALTGTPIENGLADLWSIFDFLMPGYLSNYSHFKSRYEYLIMHDDDEALETLKKRVSPFILRRTKKDVLKDLPDKIEDYYYYKMSPKHEDVYKAYVEKLKDDIKNNGGNNILALLTRLRQICITPELIYQESFENTKINMAIDLIQSSIDSGHRILVFSQFAQSFPILSKELEKMGIKHFILDGQTKAKTRMEMVEEFNKNENYKVFIISLKAGGTGLNLVGADMVIHLDPWWNSSAEAQATDRAYRIGQTKNVYVIKLICKDTIEEKVVKLQSLKKDLADSIIMSNDKEAHKLSKDDILELLES